VTQAGSYTCLLVDLDLALVHRVGSRPCGLVFIAISFLDYVRYYPFRYESHMKA
jgi:hypothetical protein